MSLPTVAIFKKGKTTVGAGHCNVGWNFGHVAFRQCVIDAMDDAWERYREDAKPVNPDDRLNRYFTTAEDLKNFQAIIIYGRVIPRSLALRVYFDKLSGDEWKNECLTLELDSDDADYQFEIDMKCKYCKVDMVHGIAIDPKCPDNALCNPRSFDNWKNITVIYVYKCPQCGHSEYAE